MTGFLAWGPRPRLAAALVALVALLSLPRPAPAAIPLSSTEARLLRDGQILYRAEVPAGGTTQPGLGGTAIALVHADAETVWRTLVDYPGHAGLFPRVTESRVVERGGDRTLLRYRVSIGPFAFRFFVNTYADATAHLLRFELDHDRPNDLFRDHWGYWKVDPWEDGVLVTHAMGGRTTLPAFLTRGAGQDGTVQPLRALKERLERL